jgi:GT2 family glycosyltransferase
VTSSGFDSLAIVVVNYGSAALLEQNLAPLAASVPGATVVVVDNFLNETERDRVTELSTLRGWQRELCATNTGFGVGVNLGVARARSLGATEFLLLNPDALLTVESLRILADHVRTEPMTLVAPTVFRPDGSLWFGGSDLYLDDGRIRSLKRRKPGARVEPWLSGACLMVSDELWERVGGFSDEYFLYWEDVDLSYRVVRAGGRLVVLAAATAVHAEGGTQDVQAASAGSAKSPTYYYYNIRNRLLFASRHLTTEDLRRWRRVTLPVAREVLLQGGRRQFLRSPRPVIAAARGVRDGLRFARDELRVRREREGSR